MIQRHTPIMLQLNYPHSLLEITVTGQILVWIPFSWKPHKIGKNSMTLEKPSQR